MDIELYREKLISTLLSIRPSGWASGRKEIWLRCPFCGDSHKSLNKGHMYIYVQFKEDEAPFFKCMKCETAGVVNDYVLSLLDANDPILNELQTAHFQSMKKTFGKNVKSMTGKLDLVVPAPLANVKSTNKLRYINERLGIKLQIEDIQKYKIITSLYDFLMYNRINNLTRKRIIGDMLDNDYVGFLTCNNDYLVCRNTTDNVDDDYRKRYINYNVLGRMDNCNKFYFIQNNIDVMQHVDIILTEGIFDILGIYNHVYEKDNNNKIYGACCGLGYKSIILFLLKKGILHCDLHIYGDSDQKLDMYRQLKKELKNKFNGTIYVYKNTIGKDYGVPKNEMKIRRVFTLGS